MRPRERPCSAKNQSDVYRPRRRRDAAGTVAFNFRPCAGFTSSGRTPAGFGGFRRVEQMEQGPARKPALPTVSLAAAGAAGVSLAVVAVPWLRMSVEAPSLRVALETGGSLLAVTTVALLLRQCGLRSRADHLWLMAGLIILAATSLAVAGMIVGGVWSPEKARYAMGGNLAGPLMLAIAAFAPSRKLRVKPRTLLIGAAALGLTVAALGSLLAGVGPAMRAPNATWPSWHAELGRLLVQVATAAALVAAAAGLARREEPLLRWVAVAVILAGIAKLD